jgi:hypothetical protein
MTHTEIEPGVAAPGPGPDATSCHANARPREEYDDEFWLDAKLKGMEAR